MAQSVRLAILWHMHQPAYRNFYDDAYVMPLTFLHATKDYYEMLKVATNHEGARVSFNLVPSLIDQLADYAGGGIKDLVLSTLLKPVADLDEGEIETLLTFLFIGDVRHMILPLRRYYELFDKRERQPPFTPPSRIFTRDELLDIEVLFLLAWTGTTIRQEEPLVQELIARGSEYSQGDKEDLVRLLQRRVSEILDHYREAQDRGLIEMTTSPYYHPILPLLINFHSARAVIRQIPLPVTCGDLTEDASLHLDRALSRYRETFGMECAGMWPSEGAVSSEALELMISKGLRYAASDEAVLANSLSLSGRAFSSNRQELYRPYVFGREGQEITVFFRDRVLSDLVGFTYQHMEPQAAVSNFMDRINDIRSSLPDENAVITVILDGENAWEHYPNNGRDFLDQFYQALVDDDRVSLVTFSDLLGGDDHYPTLPEIVPGSWVGGHLAIWVGHREKNRAWELVCRARADLFAQRGEIAEEAWAKGMEQLLIAEGSDWYWWFGDDHFSIISDRFDELFRAHLINVYRFIGQTVPQDLYVPIKKPVLKGHIAAPTAILEPEIDGRVTDYFEWLNAGRFDLSFEQGTMHRAGAVFQDLYYGFGPGFLFLRLDSEGDMSRKLAGNMLMVETVGTHEREIRLDIGEAAGTAADDHARKAGVLSAVDRILEVGLPLDYIGAVEGGEVLLSFTLWKDDTPVEKAPLFSMVKILVPENYDLEYWMI
ncbi:MAG: glycoside hydrolase [bacterium]|nr:MAG: glycoside hydrolase [bacterium]